MAHEVGIKASEATPIIEQVNAAMDRWSDFANQAGCTKEITTTIEKALDRI